MKKNSKSGSSALDLFPDLFAEKAETKAKPLDAPIDFEQAPEQQEKPVKTKTTVETDPGSLAPPAPPDTAWLPEGVRRQEDDMGESTRRGLIFITGDGKRALVKAKVEELGFLTHEVFSADEAIAEYDRLTYSLVICDVEDAMPTFHEYMKWQPMTRRRLTFYTLVGKRLYTLYDLQALSLSANMVVSDRHLHYLEKILTKGFADYEKLFNPLLEELQVNFQPQFS